MNVKLERESRGLSQQELATKAGIGIATLSRLENGKNKPNKATLAVLARALGVNLKNINQGDENGGNK